MTESLNTGNFNTARRLVSKLESRGIAGVCLEDKLFPKSNSLLSDSNQPLADIEEFCLKIKACKDFQKDPDFQVCHRFNYIELFLSKALRILYFEQILDMS